MLAPRRHCRRALPFWMIPVTSGPAATSRTTCAAVLTSWARSASMCSGPREEEQAHHQRHQHEGDVAVDPAGAVGPDLVGGGGDPVLDPGVEHGLGQVHPLALVAEALDHVR